MKLLLKFMLNMAQIPALAFTSWDDAFIRDELFKGVEKLKENLGALSEDIDYQKLSEEDLTTLGFRKWDEYGDWLIPMWLFKLLPDDTQLYSPLVDSEKEINRSLRKDADDDYRMGLSAYALFELRPDSYLM